MEPHDENNLNNLNNESPDRISRLTAETHAKTPGNAQQHLGASGNSSGSSSEDIADDSFASVITVVPLQRVGRSLWQPPGSPGAAIDPPRASTDSFRSNLRSGLRLRRESAASDPFVDPRSSAGTTATTESSAPLLGAVPARPERAHTVQRGRETRRDLSGGRQSIETTPGEGPDIIRSPTHTTATNSTFRPGTTGNSSNSFDTSADANKTTTTSLNSPFNDINLSSPLRHRTDSTLAMKDGKSGKDDDLSKVTPSSKDKSVLGSIKRGINNFGSIRERKTLKANSDESGAKTGCGSGTSGDSTIKKKKSFGDLLESIKKATTPRPRAQAAFELQPFPSEQSMAGGLLLHGPQRLELARGGDGRYSARNKHGPVFPPRLPLKPRTEPRRGDPNLGRFLTPGPALSRDDGPGGEASGSDSWSPRPDPYENKPLPALPPQRRMRGDSTTRSGTRDIGGTARRETNRGRDESR